MNFRKSLPRENRVNGIVENDSTELKMRVAKNDNTEKWRHWKMTELEHDETQKRQHWRMTVAVLEHTTALISYE